jgi:hypothetical protein
MTGSPSLPAVLWPTAMQELVLDVAIGPQPGVMRSFDEWKGRIDLDDYFGHATFRLLPLMFQRLHAMQVTDPVLAILRGVYRKSWCEMQALRFAMKPVLAALEGAGIETMLIKGAVLQIAYYRNEAVRPMSDLDIVVRPTQAEAATLLLESIGWVRNETARGDDAAWRHSMMFRDGKGHEIDLHWHLMREACHPDASTIFWSEAEPLDYAGIATRQPGPADMLLHTVIHGLRANREPPIRWIADAMTVIAVAGPRLDWNRLLERAQALRLNARLGLGLGYLSRRFDAAVPPEILQALARRRPHWVERVENSVVLRDADRMYERALTKPWVMFAEYIRVAHTANPIRFVNGFTHYLRYRGRARGRLELASDALRGLGRRVGRALSPR